MDMPKYGEQAAHGSDLVRYVGFGVGILTPEQRDRIPVKTSGDDELPYAVIKMFYQCEPGCSTAHDTEPAFLSLPGLASVIATIIEHVPAADRPALDAAIDQHRAHVRALIAGGQL